MPSARAKGLYQEKKKKAAVENQATFWRFFLFVFSAKGKSTLPPCGQTGHYVFFLRMRSNHSWPVSWVLSRRSAPFIPSLLQQKDCRSGPVPHRFPKDKPDTKFVTISLLQLLRLIPTGPWSLKWDFSERSQVLSGDSSGIFSIIPAWGDLWSDRIG